MHYSRWFRAISATTPLVRWIRISAAAAAAAAGFFLSRRYGPGSDHISTHNERYSRWADTGDACRVKAQVVKQTPGRV
jgi:hypothetical protein